MYGMNHSPSIFSYFNFGFIKKQNMTDVRRLTLLYYSKNTQMIKQAFENEMYIYLFFQ